MKATGTMKATRTIKRLAAALLLVVVAAGSAGTAWAAEENTDGFILFRGIPFNLTQEEAKAAFLESGIDLASAKVRTSSSMVSYSIKDFNYDGELVNLYIYFEGEPEQEKLYSITVSRELLSTDEAYTYDTTRRIFGEYSAREAAITEKFGPIDVIRCTINSPQYNYAVYTTSFQGILADYAIADTLYAGTGLMCNAFIKNISCALGMYKHIENWTAPGLEYVYDETYRNHLWGEEQLVKFSLLDQTPPPEGYSRRAALQAELSNTIGALPEVQSVTVDNEAASKISIYVHDGLRGGNKLEKEAFMQSCHELIGASLSLQLLREEGLDLTLEAKDYAVFYKTTANKLVYALTGGNMCDFE